MVSWTNRWADSQCLREFSRALVGSESDALDLPVIIRVSGYTVRGSSLQSRSPMTHQYAQPQKSIEIALPVAGKDGMQVNSTTCLRQLLCLVQTFKVSVLQHKE